MKIGILGYGSIGKRHANNLLAGGHSINVYDPVFANSETENSVISDSDAVVIASPTAFHLKHVKMCAEANKPMFLEKPIADSLSAEFLDAAIASKIVMVGYNLRFHSCVIKAKEWIANGDIDTPIWGSFTCAQVNTRPAYLRDGVIRNWSHEIDLSLDIMGPATVSAASALMIDGNDTIADIVLGHSSGSRSTIHLDYVTKPEIRQTLIVGSAGHVIMDLVNRQAWLRDSDGEIIEAFKSTDSFDTNYRDEMEAFVARLNGEQTIGASIQDGISAMRICDEARRLCTE